MKSIWTNDRPLERFGFFFVQVFCFSFIVQFPTNTQLLFQLPQHLNQILAPIYAGLGKLVFGFDSFDPVVTSDSKAMFSMVVFSILIAFISGLALTITKTRFSVDKIRFWFLVLLRYYLAYQLFQYGFNKIFKWQFFMPEPNTAYTPLGQMTPDLLYWSAVGSSYGYTVFAGIMEVAAATFLLFRKSFRLGAVMAVIIMANVVAINFGFNISVKLFSSFLLFTSILILWPDRRKLLAFLFNGSITKTHQIKPPFAQSRVLYIITKTIVVLLMLTDSLYPYAKSGNWNDDLVERPKFHGAYEVAQPNTLNWQQAFFHRKGYFIVKNGEDEFIDYQIGYDTIGHRFLLERDDEKRYLSYLEEPKSLKINDLQTSDSAVLRPLPYRNLPIFRSQFNWWVD